MGMKMFASFIVMAALLMPSLSLQGCMKDQAELEKRILAHDPSFRKILDKRNSLRDQLNTRKTDLLRKQRDIDSRISALKQEKVNAEKNYSAQADKIKRQILPEKRQLERDLLDMRREYKTNKVKLANVNKDIKEINDLIRKKDDLALTREEIRTWNDRLASLIKDKETAASEKNKVQKEIEVTKMKIKVLNVR